MIRAIAQLFARVRGSIGRMLLVLWPNGYIGIPGPPGLMGPPGRDGKDGRDGTLSLDVKTIHALNATGCTHFVLKVKIVAGVNAAEVSREVRELWKHYMPGTKLMVMHHDDELIPIRATPAKSAPRKTPGKATRKTAARKAAK